MSIKVTLGFCFAVVFQLNVVLCAPPVSIPSAIGSASPTENHLSPSFGNPAPNGLAQKFGGFDPNQQQQMIQKPTYDFQRPMYFPSPYSNLQPFQMPMNFFENEKGMFYGNPAYRPFNGAPGAGIGLYGGNAPPPNQYPTQSQLQYQAQQQYPSGFQSSPYQSQNALQNLSPFSRSSISQRKSDDLDKKPSH